MEESLEFIEAQNPSDQQESLEEENVLENLVNKSTQLVITQEDI